MNDINHNLLAFLSASPTAFHACENLAARLRGEGYRELNEFEAWPLCAGGKYFLRRNGSALIAFRIPEGERRGFSMMAAHADSPSFKLKEHASAASAGMYTRLSVEKYGGMICSSWLDRPLSVAGRVAVREGEKVVMRLVNLDRDLLLIPNVAIHMDRSANDGKKYDVNVDMLPLFGDASAEGALEKLLAAELGVKEENILFTDLSLYPRTPGCVWGAKNEYISSPRLDDLQCVFGCTEGFLQASEQGNIPVLCVFDNEEVGSSTKQGADSTLLEDTLSRICEALGMDLRRAVAQSFLVSADNAHAVHPNHPEYADRGDRPEMNKGIVVKFNASQKYTSDAFSAAVFAEICARAGVPTQRYTNRPDMPGGSTLGNISTAHVSVDSVDIGLAQLAMHSAYETAGSLDTEYLIRAARAFYSAELTRSSDGMHIG